MADIQKIMAAIDLSDYSRPVLEEAAQMAAAFKAELVIANIIHQRDVDTIKKVYPLNSRMVSPEAFVEKRKQDQKAAIEKLMEQCGLKDGSARIVFRVGIPYRALLKLVKTEKVSLVVMGPRGRGDNPAYILFGTNAEKMFRHCPVPLLSVRYNDKRSPKRKPAAFESA